MSIAYFDAPSKQVHLQELRNRLIGRRNIHGKKFILLKSREWFVITNHITLLMDQLLDGFFIFTFNGSNFIILHYYIYIFLFCRQIPRKQAYELTEQNRTEPTPPPNILHDIFT